jgi:hypothetical protein
MNTIDMILDGVTWVAVDPPKVAGDLPYVTHTGTFAIGIFEMQCYQLSNGQRVIAKESIASLFGFDSVEAFEADVLAVSKLTGSDLNLAEKEIAFYE